MKVCTKCLTSKPLADFGPHKKSKDGLAYYCRKCDCARVRQYARSRTHDPGRRARRHGLSPASVAAMEANGCNACGAADGPFVIDHDHSCCPGSYSCGECARGALCRNCNLALGLVGDSVEKLTGLVRYLQGSRPSGQVEHIPFV